MDGFRALAPRCERTPDAGVVAAQWAEGALIAIENSFAFVHKEHPLSFAYMRPCWTNSRVCSAADAGRRGSGAGRRLD
jgi:hypothetical protein